MSFNANIIYWATKIYCSSTQSWVAVQNKVQAVILDRTEMKHQFATFFV